jgi:hypothetical protein
MLQKLKRSRLRQIFLLDSSPNYFERNLLPVANQYKINVTEKNRKFIVQLFVWVRDVLVNLLHWGCNYETIIDQVIKWNSTYNWKERVFFSGKNYNNK